MMDRTIAAFSLVRSPTSLVRTDLKIATDHRTVLRKWVNRKLSGTDVSVFYPPLQPIVENLKAVTV